MTNPSPQRINLFEALRGLLAFWVLFAHIGLFAGITPYIGGMLRPIAFFNLTAGHAVEVFMILSGFVIFFLLNKSQETYGVFLFRRFFRLVPVFFVAILAGVFLNGTHQAVLQKVSWNTHPWIQDQLALAQNDALYFWQHILTHIPMLHGVIPENVVPRTDAAFSGPGWSISTEWQFYLIAPLLFYACRSRFGFVVFTVCAALCPFLPPLFPQINGGHALRSFVLTQIPWFYIGTASFFLYREVQGAARPDSRLLKTILVLMLIYFAVRHRLWFAIGIWVIVFGLVLMDMAGKRMGVPFVRLLNSSILQYLGKISYPIYLLHWPILIAALAVLVSINPQVNRVMAYWILMVVVPVATIGAAHVIHQWVEQPAIDFARRVCKGKGKAASPETAPLDSKAI